MQNHAVAAAREARKDETKASHSAASIASNHDNRRVLATFTLNAKQKIAAKREIRDMVNYFIFLALFLTVVIQTTSGDDMFKLSRLIKANLAEMNFQLTNTSVYKSYNTIDNVDELYEYMGSMV
ncbi:unnamed protein product [Aphanomyces euteiches]